MCNTNQIGNNVSLLGVKTNMSNRTPTAEQQAIIDAALGGGNLVIQAGAGTGKTSTLEMIAEVLPKKAIYIAYNKSIATEAAAKFPSHVTAKTSHSLAFAAVGRKYAKRLNAGRMPAKTVAALLGADWLRLDADTSVSPYRIASITQATVRRFCYSADTEITGYHVPRQNGIGGEHHERLKKAVVPLAKKYWADVNNVSGRLPFEHDHYLKIWALGNPKLDAEVVFLDEAQDSNPVIANLVRNQDHAQQIVVGDGCQQMYAWRGAVDALATWPNAVQLYLTQSWRFGEVIAQEANSWLAQLDTPLRLTGNPAIESKLAAVSDPDAILCRTNGGALASVISSLKAGKKVALVGGGDSLARLAEAAKDLIAGRKTSHPELYAFPDWQSVREYVANDESAGDLKTLVRLIDEHGADVIISTTKQLVVEAQADVVVSTAHKAKGREWDTVRLGGDFFTADEDGELPAAEIMIGYVAATRAKLVLDRGVVGEDS